ncbi:MAG: helix-turn-helix domain-containing protein [Thermomicrobiales bacterium]
MNEERRHTVSSGYVFADLGFADPETELAKAELARHISQIIEDRNWTQATAAWAMGIDQPKVSALMRGRLEGFSTDRLMRLLNALGQNVQIVVTPKPASRPRAHISVHGTHKAIDAATSDSGDAIR